MTRGEAPITRIARAYAQWRADRDARIATAWVAALAGFVLAINLWIAFTPQGMAVWVWFTG